MNKIQSVVLIDNNEIDVFVNRKFFEYNGIFDIVSFTNPNHALSYLKETNSIYQLILTDIYLPVVDGFEFIQKFNDLGLHKTHGKICILSASLNPEHKDKSLKMKVKFFEKPLTSEDLINLIS